jgi:hypothetical protein
MTARRLGVSLRVAMTSESRHPFRLAVLTSHADTTQLSVPERLLIAVAKNAASTGTSNRLA